MLGRVIDPMVESKKIHERDKQKQMEYFDLHREELIQEEMARLSNRRVTVIHDFDSGPCASCRRDRSKCDDGRNCPKKKVSMVAD